MTKIFRFVILSLGCISIANAAMTNSGKYSTTDSIAWGDFINKAEGVIEGKRSTFLKITNYGTANLDNCLMKGEFISFGTVLANETQFLKNLTVNTGETTLNSCKLENLIISNESNESDSPRVILKGYTVIQGSVEFKGDSGSVYKGADVTILGDIINGTVLDLQE